MFDLFAFIFEQKSKYFSDDYSGRRICQIEVLQDS